MPSLDDELILEESLWRCLEASSKSPVRRLYLKGWGKTYNRDRINQNQCLYSYSDTYPRHSLFQFHLQKCRFQVTRWWMRFNLNTQFLTHLSNEYNVYLTCMKYLISPCITDTCLTIYVFLVMNKNSPIYFHYKQKYIMSSACDPALT